MWLNPVLLRFTKKHKWWHFLFMSERCSGWVHHDREGYVNNYVEKTCSKCGYVQKIDHYYKE